MTETLKIQLALSGLQIMTLEVASHLLPDDKGEAAGKVGA